MAREERRRKKAANAPASAAVDASAGAAVDVNVSASANASAAAPASPASASAAPASPLCERPSGFAQYRTLLGKDVRQELRTKEMLVSMGVYALLVIIVYGVGLSFAKPGGEFLEISGGLLWALIVFTSLLGLNRSFASEKENGCIEGLLLAPLDRGVVFLAKATSNFLFLVIVEVIAVPLFWVFFSSYAQPGDTAPLLVVPLLIGSVGIAGVGTLLSTITANTRGKDVMLALLFVPVIFPLLYACVSATTAVLLGGDVMADTLMVSLALAAGYDVIMILASWVLYDFVVS